MAGHPLWLVLWVIAAGITGAVMFGAWSGPHQAVSNLSRWAVRLRSPWVPSWLIPRAADRWAFRGGLGCLAILLAVAWLVPPQRPPVVPVPDNADLGKTPVVPDRPSTPQNPARHVDSELKNAILVHVPKNKQVRIVVLKDDPEADQFSWEVDALLRAEGYTMTPRAFFTMATGAKLPSGTTMYPDEKDPNIVVIRIGQNDRN